MGRMRDSDSRCTKPNDPPLEWRFARIPGESTVKEEIHACLAALTEADRQLHLAAVLATMRAAAAGTLWPRTGVRCVSQEPIFELRWNEDGRLWRLYEGEPRTEPNLLVALRFHEKRIDDDDRLTRSLQDDEIALAERRYGVGIATRWGESRAYR